MKWSLKAIREQACDLYIDVDSIASLRDHAGSPEQLYFIVDELVKARLAQRCYETGLGNQIKMSVVQGGESAKSYETYTRLLGELEDANVLRRDCIVCVGGSAVSDVGGFVAATYLRGINYINIPTTVMAQVDGAFGGKVALNTTRGKNAVGAFWHPTHVYVDQAWLSTLPATEAAHGFVESVKVACVDNSGMLFEKLESLSRQFARWPEETGREVIMLSLETKLRLLAPDPFEYDLRRLLNLGHTVAHALEAAAAYKGLHHGAAVAVGIATAWRYGELCNMSKAEHGERVVRLLARLGLATSLGVMDAELVIAHLESVRRARNGVLNYVVPVKLGQAVVIPEIDLSLLRAALAPS